MVKLAIIGCGNFTFNTLYPMLRKQPIRLAAICDTAPEQTERFAAFYNAGVRYTDYREMILTEKPDGVICAVNASVHYEAAKFCLENNVTIFVEKTPCETAKQAEELAELQKAGGKFVVTGFNRRFVNSYMMTREIIQRPEFGSVSMYYSKFNSDPYLSNDYYIFNHIIHHLDLARYLLGEIAGIKVQSRIVNGRSGAFEVHFKALETGAVGTIQAASMLNEAYPMEILDIAGTNGNVVVNNIRDLRYNRTGPHRNVETPEPLKNDGDCLSWNLSGGFGVGSGIYSYLGFETELDQFIKAITGGTRPACTIEESIGTMKVMEEVRKAVNGEGFCLKDQR
jgi:predicted dehydrogenase